MRAIVKLVYMNNPSDLDDRTVEKYEFSDAEYKKVATKFKELRKKILKQGFSFDTKVGSGEFHETNVYKHADGREVNLIRDVIV